MKLYFCSECGTLTSLENEAEEGDECPNCGNDHYNQEPIVGEFSNSDAKHLKSLGET